VPRFQVTVCYLVAAVAVALALAGCGGGSAGGSGGEGAGGDTATLWVTRDHGAEVIVEAQVPAGLTVVQALEREAEIETRYGGRFVQAVNGIEGSLDKRRDWFYFVNGIEPNRGGTELTLRAGDVAWWDFRSWEDTMAQPVVVGAFPEPFLHGWDGKRRPAEVRGPPELSGESAALLRILGGPSGEGDPNVFLLEIDEGAEGALLTAERGPENGSPVTFTLTGSLDAVRAAAAALANDPSLVRFRYEARFDEAGNVVE
jgi:Domain of unknown function (DUF4430)